MNKKLTRGQKAWQTRKANLVKQKPKHKIVEGLKEAIAFTESGPLISDLGSTMVLLERALDDLIIRINLQTQRIKDMM